MIESLFGAESPRAHNDNLSQLYSIDHRKKYGEGGYGATYAARDRRTGEALAVKIVDTRRMRLDAVKRECEILSSLNHPNIISVRAHGPGDQARNEEHLYFIFMEVASGGELFDQVVERGTNAMSEDTARELFRQLIAGVKCCHENGVAHRDLKLENVLLTKDQIVKVIDFGLSHQYPRTKSGIIDRSKPLKEICGSKSYAAPEVMAGLYEGFAADMWSLGVCLFAMLSGFFPLDEASKRDWRFERLAQGQFRGVSTTHLVYSWYKRSPDHLSREVVDLLNRMLMIDPAKRASMVDVLSHPWITAGGVPMQDHFDVGGEVVDVDGPRFRGVKIPEGAVLQTAYYDDEEFDPVYRSLAELNDGLEEEVTLPTLARQEAFGRQGGCTRIY